MGFHLRLIVIFSTPNILSNLVSATEQRFHIFLTKVVLAACAASSTVLNLGNMSNIAACASGSI